MRKSGGKSSRGPGTTTRAAGGKTTIASTITPVFGASKGRASASRLKRRPTTGR